MRVLFSSCVASALALALCHCAVRAGADPVQPLLPGTQNSRDIGGLSTADGHVVKRGVVYRSDSLGTLSDAGMAEMTRLGILEDDDLRTDKERAQAPDRLPEGVRDNAREVLSEEDFKQHPRFYPSFVSSERARGAVAQVLKDIENESGAMLYHCSAGQDRTGWVTAVLLTLLGVPRETVDADYLLSNAFHEAAGSSERVDMPELDSAFAEMDRMYGSFDNFVHDGLGLTEDDIAGLNARLLE